MILSFIISAISVAPYFITTGGIADHGFDEELVAGEFSHWTFSGAGTFIRDNDDKYDGEACAQVTAAASGDNYFSQNLVAADLEVGKTYFLSFRYKILEADLTAGSGGGAICRLAIRGGVNDGVVYAATKPQTKFSRGVWQSVQLVFTARSDDSTIMVGMWSASGKIALDDVRINVMEERDGAAVVNPGFEPFGAVGSVPFGWTEDLHSGTVATVNDDYISGSAAVKLARTGAGTTKLSQTISIPAGKSLGYEGQIYIKHEAVGSGGAKLRIYQTVSGGTQDLFTSPTFTGNGGWLRLPIAFKTVPDASATNQLTIELSLADTGSVRFDSLQLRLTTLQAADFDQDDWQDYWSVSGIADATVQDAGGGKKKLHIYQDDFGESTIKQSFDAIPGLTYMLYGSLSAELETASADDNSAGLFVQLYDRGREQVTAEEGPIVVSTARYWTLDLYPDQLTGVSSGRYELRYYLKNCTGKVELLSAGSVEAAFDTECKVIPLPLNVRYQSAEVQELGAEGSTWYLVYPDDSSLPEEPERNPGFRCAFDLATDLTGGRMPGKTAYTFYFNIGQSKVKGQLVKLSEFDPLVHKPAIVIGQVASTPSGIPPYPEFEDYLTTRGVDIAGIATLGEEGYYVDVPVGEDPIILLVSAGAAGRYYATQTFLQLIEVLRGETDRYFLPEVTIWDKSDTPIRAVHFHYPREYLQEPGALGFGAEQWRKFQYKADWLLPNKNTAPLQDDDRPALEVYVRLLSRLKINMITIENSIYYCLEEPSGSRGYNGEMLTNLQLIKPLFDYCRKYYINPVPKMQSFGHGYHVLQFLPTEVECCWVGGDTAENQSYPPPRGRVDSPMPQPAEKFLLDSSRTHIFAHEMVVVTDDRPVKVQHAASGELAHFDDFPQYDEQHRLNWWLEYNPIDFDHINGFTTTSVTGTSVPGEMDYHNCAIHFGNHVPVNSDLYRVSYHHVNSPRLIPYDSLHHGLDSCAFSNCPQSDAVHKFMQERIDQVVQYLHPTMIDFGHDEPWQVHTCAKCFPQQDDEFHSGHTVKPNGLLIGRDINYLIGCYKQSAQNYGMDPAAVRGLVMADHLSQPHEEYKVPDRELDPEGFYLWWDYRGRPFKLGGYYQMDGYLNSGKWLVREKHQDTVMLDWSLGVDIQDETPGKTHHDWDKWRDIDDLTRAGFEVMGGSSGFPFAPYAPDPHVGAVARVRLYKSAPIPNDPHPEFDLPLLMDLEGSYEQPIPLSQNYEDIPLPDLNHDNSCLDDSGRAWFAYRMYNFTGYHRETTPTGSIYDRAEFKLDIVGERAEGEAWIDDAALMWNRPLGGNNHIIRPPLFGDTEIRNGGFEDSGTGGQTFDFWENPTDPYLTSDKDEEIFRDIHGNLASCHITRTSSTTTSIGIHPVWQTNIALDPIIPPGSHVNIRAYLRTHKVDTLRMWCPWQWARCGSEFRRRSKNGGRWLGGMNFLWDPCMLPRVDIYNMTWKTRVGDVAVSDFNWRWREKPEAYKLKYLRYDPFMIFEKEVPW